MRLCEPSGMPAHPNAPMRRCQQPRMPAQACRGRAVRLLEKQCVYMQRTCQLACWFAKVFGDQYLCHGYWKNNDFAASVVACVGQLGPTLCCGGCAPAATLLLTAVDCCQLVPGRFPFCALVQHTLERACGGMCVYVCVLAPWGVTMCAMCVCRVCACPVGG